MVGEISAHPSCSHGRLSYGAKCLKNSRNVLEDAYSAHELQLPSALGPSGHHELLRSLGSLQFYGVFDGHGGPEAAQHASGRLHIRFKEALERQALETVSSDGECSVASSTPSATANADAVLSEACPGSASGSEMDLAVDLSSAAETGTPSGGSGAWWANSVRSMPPLSDRYSKSVKHALQSAFIATDAELAGTEIGDCVGTTAVVAVVGKTEVFVAHCGDSRAVLCRKGGAIALTSDHKPDRSDEAARVSALGGKVVYKNGSHRVMGLLAMTRAIGDHFLRPYIIPEPEVTSLQRTHEDELLLLASDGLWDVFSCQEATTLALRSTMRARERGASSSAACRVGASVLVRGAIERGSRDNITVLIIDLRRHDGAGSVAAVLASQCSDAIPFQHRRKRGSSGADDEGQEVVTSSTADGSFSCSNGSSRDSRSCGGALNPCPVPAAVQPFSSVTGSYWGGGARFSQPQHMMHCQQPPRQTHLEGLVSTWAAASAAFSNRSPRSSSISSPGGRASPTAAAPSPPRDSGSSSNSRRSAPGCQMTTAGAAVSNGTQESLPLASLAGAAAAGQTQQQQQQRQLMLDSMASAPLATGSSSSTVVKPATGVPSQPRVSPCAVRSHSFTSYEQQQRGRRQSSEPACIADHLQQATTVADQQVTAAAAGLQVKPAVAAVLTASLANGLFVGSGSFSAVKPPLPPSAFQQLQQ